MRNNRMKCKYCDFTVMRFRGKKTGHHTLLSHVQEKHQEEYLESNHPAIFTGDLHQYTGCDLYVNLYPYDTGWRWAMYCEDVAHMPVLVARALKTYPDPDSAQAGAEIVAYMKELGTLRQ